MVSQLRSVPGIGVLTATALVASVGNVQRFPSARHFASYLGLTPREHASGSRRHLGAISKRGDTYLRMLLIHGARAVSQQSRGRARQQAGANRLGRVEARHRLHRDSRCGRRGLSQKGGKRQGSDTAHSPRRAREHDDVKATRL